MPRTSWLFLATIFGFAFSASCGGENAATPAKTAASDARGADDAGGVIGMTEPRATDASAAQCFRGTLAGDTTWLAKNSPIVVCESVKVPARATLTIEPGAIVTFQTGAGLTIENGGRLIAEGTADKKISFTRPAGTNGNWGSVTIHGSPGSPETRVSYVHFEFNATSSTIPCIHAAAGTVWLDHLSFGNTLSPYLHVDGASFVVSDSSFPAPTGKFEPVHGTGGIKAGGRGVFVRNFFGVTNGYNDSVDFTGGNRPGGAIVHFINNVFAGSDDDAVDLDGTDAWIEGNIFMHIHKNRGTPDSATAISGGAESGQTSEITAIGNIFYDVDGMTNAKEGNFYTFSGNTIVRQNHSAGDDSEGAIVTLADDKTAEGAGVYLEHNIIVDAEMLVRNRKTATVTFAENLMALPWMGLGTGNVAAEPRLKRIPTLTETNFSTWAQAQVMRDWFSLQADSPGRGTGANGADKGAVNPIGVSISGEPNGTTPLSTATLTVGSNRSGNGIPAAGWPNGAGYTHYKWRLDGGTWSPEQALAEPIKLSGLSKGPHRIEVTGKRDSGLYQDDPAFAADAIVSQSRMWTVGP